MSRLVLDCSVSMAWCFEDEASAYSDGVLDHLVVSEALVPSLWLLETANVLTSAQRQGRISAADVSRYVDLLSALPISPEPETTGRVFGQVLPLAVSSGLSAYDAAYLDLAMRHGLALATQDKAMRKAARKAGIAVFEPGAK